MQKTPDDLQFYLEDTGGSGPPLLLIHAFPLNSQMWKPQLEGLAGSFRVLAPDLRGHGLTPPVPGVSTMDALAQDLHTILEQAGVLQPPILCGVSMGGYIALAFYRQFPGTVGGLILTATRATADSEAVKANRDKQMGLVHSGGVPALVEEMLPKMLSQETFRYNPGLVEQVRRIMLESSPEGIVAALLGMKERPDSTALLGQIPFPVLVVYGEDDAIVQNSEAEEMATQLDHGHLVSIPDAGHLLNLEQPVLFNQVVRDYQSILENFKLEST